MGVSTRFANNFFLRHYYNCEVHRGRQIIVQKSTGSIDLIKSLIILQRLKYQVQLIKDISRWH